MGALTVGLLAGSTAAGLLAAPLGLPGVFLLAGALAALAALLAPRRRPARLRA